MSSGGWTGRAMAAAARGCARRPLTVIVVSVILAAASLYYTARTITVVTSHLRLLPQNEPYVVRLKEYQRDFGELNDIVIVVESAAPELSKAYAARLVRELGRDGLASDRITYRIDPEYFRGAGLLYLSVDELTKLRERLFDYQEFIEEYAAQPTLSRLLEALNQQIANAMVAGFFDLGLGVERSGGDFRFLETVIDQISNGVAGAAAYSSPWSTAFSGGRLDDPDAGYFFSSDRHWLFLLVTQRRQEGDFGGNRGTIEGIRRAIARLGPEYADVKAGVTGGPAIASDEMTTALGDSQVATVLAIGFTMGLLLLALRRVVKPVVMVAVLLVSLAWSFGIITLVIGHLTIFSVMFISIVVGIGIDYGVYFLFRYEEELGQLPTPIAAVARTAERAGPGMLLGALTAAGAFFVLMLTDFQGIREFGFVAGSAILVAFAAMITLFPAILALMDRRRAGTATATATDASVQRAEWLERVAQHRKTIVAGAIALTAFAVWGATHVGFDYNMLKLQAKGVESVQWEERILAKAGRSGFSALATAADLDELARKQAAFAALPSVAKVESVLMLVPDRQAEKIALIQQFAPLVAQVRVAAATAVEPADLRAPLDTLRRRLRLATEEGGDRAKQKVGPVLAKIEALRGKLVDLDRGRAAAGLERLQVEIARDFADKLGSLQKNLVPRPVRAGDAPPEIRRRYVGSSGRYLLRIHPAVDIWTQAGAERFVTDLRRVDADVTGPPITSFESIRLIRQGYVQGTLYALLLVTVVTAIILRSARGTALALIPLALGVLWTLGFMHVFDLDFNLANVWALPLIIGAAAEFGLNIFVRFQEGRDTGGPVFARSTVMAVVLNGLTTMAGFASLMVAYHRGIFGLGLLLTVGMVASLIAALLVLPVLLMTSLGATRSPRSV